MKYSLPKTVSGIESILGGLVAVERVPRWDLCAMRFDKRSWKI